MIIESILQVLLVHTWRKSPRKRQEKVVSNSITLSNRLADECGRVSLCVAVSWAYLYVRMPRVYLYVFWVAMCVDEVGGGQQGELECREDLDGNEGRETIERGREKDVPKQTSKEGNMKERE